MNLSLHEKLSQAVKSERKITAEILKLINEVESSRLHLQMGYGSLFEYLTKAQGYSESSAQRRIGSARLLKQTPTIQEKLESGDLNLTQVALVQSAFSQAQKINYVAPDKKQEILDQIQGETQLNTRRILQEAFPEVKLNSEKVVLKPKGKTIISFEVTEEELQLIEQAKALLGHSCPGQKTKDVVLKLCQKFIQSRTNPRVKSSSGNEVASVRSEQKPPETSFKISKARKPISASLRRQVFNKAQYQCEYQNTKTEQRCGCKTFLEIEHIQPVAFGGTSDAENFKNSLSAAQPAYG